MPAVGPGVAGPPAPGRLLHSTCIPETNVKPKELQLVDRSHPKGLSCPREALRGEGQICLLRKVCGRTLKISPSNCMHFKG